MDTPKGSRLILGLRAKGWSDTEIENFILWVETGDGSMPTENDRKDIQKAMAYDLLRIFREGPEKSYTYEELEKLIDEYISGLKQ